MLFLWENVENECVFEKKTVEINFINIYMVKLNVLFPHIFVLYTNFFKYI